MGCVGLGMASSTEDAWDSMVRAESPFGETGGLEIKAFWPEEKQIRPPSRKGIRPKSSYKRPSTAMIMEELDKNADELLRENLTNGMEDLCRLRPKDPVKVLAMLLFQAAGHAVPPGSKEEAEISAATKIQNMSRKKKVVVRVSAA